MSRRWSRGSHLTPITRVSLRAKDPVTCHVSPSREYVTTTATVSRCKNCLPPPPVLPPSTCIFPGEQECHHGVPLVSSWCHHRDTRDLYHQDIIVMSLLSFIFIPLISIWIYTCIKFRVWGYLTFPDPPEWLIKNHFMLHIFKSCAQIVLTETAAIVLTKYAFWWFSVFWTLGFVRLPLPRGGETSHQWKIWLIWW